MRAGPQAGAPEPGTTAYVGSRHERWWGIYLPGEMEPARDKTTCFEIKKQTKEIKNTNFSSRATYPGLQQREVGAD